MATKPAPAFGNARSALSMTWTLFSCICAGISMSIFYHWSVNGEFLEPVRLMMTDVSSDRIIQIIWFLAGSGIIFVVWMIIHGVVSDLIATAFQGGTVKK